MSPRLPGIAVDLATLAAREDRRQRSARALSAAAARYVEQRDADHARTRAAFLAYAVAMRRPVDLVTLSAPAPRPSLATLIFGASHA